MFEQYFLPGTLASGLFAGLSRPGDHYAFAKRVKAAHQNVSEAAPIGDEKRNCRNSPHYAEHGQEGARVVALQGDPGFANDFSEHRW